MNNKPTLCHVEAEIIVDGKVVRSKTWPDLDVMKTSSTRAWATRQFNIFLKDFSSCDIGRDKVIRAEWTARYGAAQGNMSINGILSGVNGKTMARRGIFE